jgi:CRP-like cAMP-binding protein
MREYSFGMGADLRATVPQDDLEKLVRAGERCVWAKGDRLYRQAEPADHVHVLLSGLIKSTTVNSNGQETLLRIHLSGSVLGLTSLATDPVRDATAIALEPSVTAMVSRPVVLAILRADAQLTTFFVRLLVDRMREFHYRVSELQSNSVEQRLAHVLLSLARQESASPAAGAALAVFLTHEELSHIVNARRQTVTLALGRFAEAGLVRQVKRRILIADPDGLRRLLPDGMELRE